MVKDHEIPVTYLEGRFLVPYNRPQFCEENDEFHHGSKCMEYSTIQRVVNYHFVAELQFILFCLILVVPIIRGATILAENLFGILMVKEVTVKGVKMTRIWASYLGNLDSRLKLVAFVCITSPRSNSVRLSEPTMITIFIAFAESYRDGF